MPTGQPDLQLDGLLRSRGMATLNRQYLVSAADAQRSPTLAPTKTISFLDGILKPQLALVVQPGKLARWQAFAGLTMTPDEVGALFHQGASASPSTELAASGSDGASGTAKLREVLAAVKQLWESDSAQLDLIAEQLGNGSRDGERPLRL
jgi:hypothetical protein